MRLKEIIDALNLEILNQGDHLDDVVQGGYSGDLLSDVIASTRKNDLWITIQTHENIIAVASLKDLSGIILAKNSVPLNETLKNAKNESVTLLRSPMTSFELVAALSNLGISGKR
ncbi:serine kinase [bacterium]|nr:serine kinase [candidate division CSSED10-310 bacterium]